MPTRPALWWRCAWGFSHPGLLVAGNARAAYAAPSTAAVPAFVCQKSLVGGGLSFLVASDRVPGIGQWQKTDLVAIDIAADSELKIEDFTMAGGRIFINYRRDDSRADAGRIYDRLSICYPGRVFRDVGSLEPGVEWREAIERVLSASDACVVVIGKSWLNINAARGRRRLDDPRDTVRMEVVTALQRRMRVIPVLVGNASMPDEQDLPEDLQPLTQRNALQITEQDWDEDIAKLTRALDQALGLPPSAVKPVAHAQAEVKARVSLFSGRLIFTLSGVLAACLVVVSVVVHNQSTQKSPGPFTATNSVTEPSTATASPAKPAAVAATPATKSEAAVSKQARMGGAAMGEANHTPAGNAPQNPLVQSQATPAATITAAGLAGKWRAVVTAPGQQLDEQVALYSDGSFSAVYQGATGAVGRWQYNAQRQVILLLNATNFMNYNVRFGCELAALGPRGDHFGGSCVDMQRTGWNVNMAHVDNESTLPVRPGIPGVDLSALSHAESLAFAELLARVPCNCGCGLNMLACRRNESEKCNVSYGYANQFLRQFLYNMRR